MKEDTKASGKQPWEDQTKAFSEMAEKAMKNYEQVFRTGVKLQEEAIKCCTGWANPARAAQEWQKGMPNVTKLTSSLLPNAQKRMEEALELAEQNSRTGAELMRKALEAAQTPTIAESQTKWADVATSSLNALRSNVEALTEINGKVIDSWMEFVRKSAQFTEPRLAKAA
jgi:hypothetical protein